MKNNKRTQEEKNINQIILFSSTIIIIFVSIVIAYLFISTEIKELKRHLRTFEKTLIQREKNSIKTKTDNLINDLRVAQNNMQKEIKKRVKDQTIIIYNLIQSIIEQNSFKSKNQIIKSIINILKTIKNVNGINFFIFDTNGTLLYNSNDRLSEGKNFIDFEDIYGKKFIQSIIQKSGFVQYTWFIPKKSKISKKITYSKKNNYLNIIVGAGIFLDQTNYISDILKKSILRKKLNNNEFFFAYKINSLNDISKHSHLIIEKNIKTDKKIAQAVKNILTKSNYTGNIYYSFNNKVIYGSYLNNERIFIAYGMDLQTIKQLLNEEKIKSHKNLIKKIYSLILNISIIALTFFILSYFVSKKIEKIFRDYRLKLEKSQQLLIQKSKMAAMGEMIGNITHQWRQPLSQLSALFYDIESAYEYKELDKKYLTSRVDQANDLLEYMSETMEEFKTFFSPDTKKEVFTLLSSINKALKIVYPSLKAYDIRLLIDVDKDIYIEGYKNALSQVILNILTNSKETAIIRKIKQPTLKIYSDIKEQNVYLHIEDNCGGIKQNIIKRIFEPYMSTKYNYGTGIGLYMSKIIIEDKMNGKISAANAKNGAIFTITLKVVKCK